MDPLSLTASIVTLVGVGVSAAKGIDKLVSLESASKVLVRIKDEVSDLQDVVSAVQAICWQHEGSIGTSRQQHCIILENALRKAKDVVLELEVLVSYRLTRASVENVKVDRIAFIRAQSRMRAIADRIRVARMDIGVAASVFTL